ncbi:MAG: tRNA 2-thiocytidine biosynthesis protein TtcA [Firmicutes bacterium]|nr:tRNA 2-thiocytidine biosynthesis protein TtcA [Bacillota bacterium]
MALYQEIERGLITTYRTRIWAKFLKAIEEYKLVNDGDKVCVCISGGKDSMLMAKLFQELKKHSKINFEVIYLVMNPGYNDDNFNLIKDNLKLLNIPAIIKETNIFDVANNMDKNPCFICARMRRGALYQMASDMGCNKIALGHHYDDVIETTLMNMLNSGTFQTMLPKLHSDNFDNMELIRPLYLIREKDILTWVNSNNLHFIRCACKLTERIHKHTGDSGSQRQETKKLIASLKDYNANVESNIFKSAENVNLDKVMAYKIDNIKHNFLDNYDTKKSVKDNDND